MIDDDVCVAQVSFHLQQIEKLILPTTTTKLCLWVMQQDKSFYSPTSALYNTFCREVGITADQSIKIQERRYGALLAVYTCNTYVLLSRSHCLAL